MLEARVAVLSWGRQASFCFSAEREDRPQQHLLRHVERHSGSLLPVGAPLRSAEPH